MTSAAKPIRHAPARPQAPRAVTDEDRWQAVVRRDAGAESSFVFAVRTTGIYCRPACPARTPLRKNVRFFDDCQRAEAAGYRPCRRCQPSGASLAQRHAEAIAQACRLIEQSGTPPSLEELACGAGMSRFHFHRVFKLQTGVTPKAYANARRAQRIRDELSRNTTVTQAMYRGGFSSSGRFYASSTNILGMTPQEFRAGGNGARIRFALGECWLGSILVASSEKGICAISLGDHPEQLIRDLQDRFAIAELVGGDRQYEQLVSKVVALVENPSIGLDLPLDIRGTAFQQRVWQALCAIPPGSTASYAEIARQIGRPQSVRAVAQACAANKLAVAIPCHRVVRTDGSLSGYRWGVDRKSQLQARERGRACGGGVRPLDADRL